MNITDELFALRDEKYKRFHSGLIPNIPADTIIGVRTPQLRKLAKTLFKEGAYEEFIGSLPHTYYEENNLHAFLIEQLKDYNDAVARTKEFLPYVDNWATCDCFAPKVFAKHKDKLIDVIYEWLDSDKTYTVRYAIGMLMRYYLDGDFDERYPEIISQIRSDEYYINMMIAWYFATALAKQRDCAMKYITGYRLSAWVHNKTIQKAVESFRISNEDKDFLKTLRIKKTDERLS